jgi:hypothetical protein
MIQFPSKIDQTNHPERAELISYGVLRQYSGCPHGWSTGRVLMWSSCCGRRNAQASRKSSTDPATAALSRQVIAGTESYRRADARRCGGRSPLWQPPLTLASTVRSFVASVGTCERGVRSPDVGRFHWREPSHVGAISSLIEQDGSRWIVWTGVDAPTV